MSLVEQLLVHVRALPGVRADALGDPVSIWAGQRVIARVWRVPSTLEISIPPEAVPLLVGIHPKYHRSRETLRIELRDADDLAVAERLFDRRLKVEHNVAQYVERSP